MGEFGGVEAQNVSAELKLFEESWLNNTEDRRRAQRIRSFSEYSREDEEEEEGLRVSTRLKLRRVDPFDFRKILTKSDCNGTCRLIVPKETVENIWFEIWDDDMVMNIMYGTGEHVRVWDNDTRTEHSLRFHRLPSSQLYVFNENWSSDFTRRRGLREGDEIGVFWDFLESRLDFRVLLKATQPMHH